MGPNELVILSYEREVHGFTFVDYLANAVQLDEQRHREARAACAISRLGHADPTAVTAVRNVERARVSR